MSAMSAMEHPALRSGRSTCWWAPVRTSADSAMKCTPQKTMNSASVTAGRHTGEPEGVAAGIGPSHDVVALVVVAEDEEPSAERGLGRADHRRQFVARRGRVALGERGLEPEHLYAPFEGVHRLAGGDSLVAHPRVCRPRCEVSCRKPGRHQSMCYRRQAAPSPSCSAREWEC